MTHAADGPTTEQPEVAPTVTTAPARAGWQRIPDHLGPARTSTVILGVLFLAIFALYLNIRPETPGAAGTGTTGTVTDTPVPSTTVEPTAPSTTVTPTTREEEPTTTEESTTSSEPTGGTDEPTPAPPTETGLPTGTTGPRPTATTPSSTG